MPKKTTLKIPVHMPLELREKNKQTFIKLSVHPAARRNSIDGTHAGRLKLSVTKAPENGKANQQVVKLLCDFFTLSKQEIEITQGLSSRNKTVSIQRSKKEILALLHEKNID